MQLRNEEKYIWTQHAEIKMRQYGLSNSRVKRVIRFPDRIEEGVIEDGVACMQKAGGKKYSEIWVMYVVVRDHHASMPLRHDSRAPAARFAKSQAKVSSAEAEEPSNLRPPLSQRHAGMVNPFLDEMKKRIKIITAWRYPGKSPERDPVPAEVLREIKNIIL